jgi:hypothetical protein
MSAWLRSGVVVVWLAALFAVGLLLPLPEAVLRAQPPGSKPLADNMANPTVPGQASYNMCWDGTTWDRCASSTVSEGTHDSAAPASPIGLFLMGKASNTAPTAVSTGDAVALRAATTGELVVKAEQSGVWDMSAGAYARDFGGCWPWQMVSDASTNATTVKSSPGQIYTLTVSNTNTADRWLKFYQMATPPTVGTSVPDQTYLVKGTGSGGGWPPIVVTFTPGLQFNNGISLAMMVGGGVTEGGAIAAGDLVLSLCYR